MQPHPDSTLRYFHRPIINAYDLLGGKLQCNLIFIPIFIKVVNHQKSRKPSITKMWEATYNEKNVS